MDKDARDWNGMTALIRAVDQGRHEEIRALIDGGANLDLTDKWGQTALMLAAGRNDAVSARMLVRAGASLRPVSKSGLTARGFAEENAYSELADYLRKAEGRER
jgi:ankyrin repeat protein